jgi:hypothetical protein
VLIANTEQKSNAEELSHKSVKESRLGEQIGILLEYLPTGV